MPGIFGDEELLWSGNGIKSSIHGGRRTGLVVKAPAVEPGNLKQFGKISHVVIPGTLHHVRLAAAGVFKDVGPAAGAALQVAGQIRKRRGEGRAVFHPLIQGGGNDGQGSALAAASYSQVLTVELGKGENI